MGKGTAIEWADHTFNGWWGCHESSPACDNCYAREWATFTGHDVWGISAPRRFFGEKHWNEPRLWNRMAAAAGRRDRVFAMSMGDWCEPRPDLDPWRAKLCALIEETANLDWLLLTKWPQLITRSVPAAWLNDPPRNVQYGTTAEDQPHWNRRVLALQLVPAHRRFVSVEPMLGRIVPKPYDFRGIHQVIIGGESDNRGKSEARQFVIEWARELAAAAGDAGVARFLKQLGSRPWHNGVTTPGTHLPMGVERLACEGPDGRRGWELLLKDAKGGNVEEWPEDLRGLREFPPALVA